MFVKVKFDRSDREYSYRYTLQSKPEKGDFFVVKTPFGYKMVTCTRVVDQDPPKIATKAVLKHLKRKSLHNIDEQFNGAWVS